MAPRKSRTPPAKGKPGPAPKPLGTDPLEQIERLAGYGMTEAAIAHILGVAPKTFARRKDAEPAILSALEKGQALAQCKVGEALYNKAIGGDLGAIVWWEKTRAGRAEKTEVKHTGTVNVSGLSDEELVARARVLLGEAA